MRNFKRFLAMTLTLLMVVSCFSFSSFAQSYDDVYDYAKAIDVLSNLQIVEGYEDGTFGPDNAVERWHMSLWIAKMETGKVPASDYLPVWKAEQNYTDFTDVNVDQYMGAINYAADEGIIIGTTATTFSPTAGITYQDALTMVVRALGYGSKTMDAGYPWKYINKASELGLEEGITGIAYTDVLTRAETAQILYNALYTVDADGETYIADVFGLTTVVITGTPEYRIIETESVIKTGYVSFNVLNADGTINDDVTYHAPATAFGIDAAKADTYVGASFKVTTKDNFKTLGTVIANPSEKFDTAKIVGQGTPAAPSGTLVTLGDKTYEAVKKYSTLYNAQGIKGNTSEILVYTTNLTQASTAGYFKVDSSYNVLDKDGKIVAYYAPAITGSYAAPYAKRLGNDAYTVFLNNSEIIAAGGVWYSSVLSEYAQTTNTYDLVKNNKYATATAYDDNADGVYDRLFYTYEEFGKIYINNDTPAVPNDYYIEDGVGRISPVVNKFIDGKTGEALATAPTGYIRYSYNQLSKYLTVYENYTSGTGLITTVNTAARKVVIGGTQYTYGIDTYPGANGAPANQTGVNTALVGKQVNYILADGIVVRVYDAASAATYIVFDNLTGLTAQGYVTALAYVQSNKASVITIATINGYSYQQYYLIANNHSLNNIADDLQTGELFEGTKDALGFWHLKTIDYTYYTDHYVEKGHRFADHDAVVEGRAEIEFENGIANLDHEDQFYYKSGALKAFSQFNTNANTVYVVYDDNNHGGTFFTAIGSPVDGAQIEVNESMYVVLAGAPTNGPTAAFVYVFDGELEGHYNSDAWKSYAYDTIIYVDGSTTATQVTDNLGTTGSLLGYTWQYSNVVDMVHGGWTTVQTLYNMQLETGSFYTVSNGYVEAKVNVNSDRAPIQEGLLSKVGNFYSVIELTAQNSGWWNSDTEKSAYTYLYRLEGNKVVINPADGSIINQVNDAAVVNAINAANTYTPVYFYAGEVPGSRVILYLSNGTSNVTTLTSSGPYTTALANEAVPAAGANTNFYSINEAAYLAVTENHTRSFFIYNLDVNDKWMRLYDPDGKEVTDNWKVEFTALVEPRFNTPIYTVGIQSDTIGKLGDGIKDYTLKFMLNNIVYILPLANLNLVSNAPFVWSGNTASVSEDSHVDSRLIVVNEEQHPHLHYAKGTDPAHGTVAVSANGEYTYTPAANYFGTDTFTIKVSDGATDVDITSVTITITVNTNGNDDSTTMANQQMTYRISEAKFIGSSQLVATDPDGLTLTFSETSESCYGKIRTAADFATWNSTDITINANGSVNYTYPIALEYGTYTVGISVNDGGTPVNAILTLTVIY